jgi:hypothetical protein
MEGPVRPDQTVERKSVKSLKDLRKLLVQEALPDNVEPHFSLKNAINGEQDCVKVAVYKFLSDYLEYPVQAIIDSLGKHGYERERIRSAVNALVIEGYLAGRGHSGHPVHPGPGNVRLLEGKMMPHESGHAREAKPWHRAPGHARPDPGGILRHQDGLDATIWKATQDHVIRPLDAVVQIVGIAGFAPHLVKAEIMLLQRKGWFDIGQAGNVLSCRLRDDIANPQVLQLKIEEECEKEFDPTRAAQPDSLLEKVQHAQREMAESSRKPDGLPDAKTLLADIGKGPFTRMERALLVHRWICQLVSDGRRMSNREIFCALEAAGFASSMKGTAGVIAKLHHDGLLQRAELVSGDPVQGYVYWLAKGADPMQVQPGGKMWRACRQALADGAHLSALRVRERIAAGGLDISVTTIEQTLLAYWKASLLFRETGAEGKAYSAGQEVRYWLARSYPACAGEDQGSLPVDPIPAPALDTPVTQIRGARRADPLAAWFASLDSVPDSTRTSAIETQPEVSNTSREKPLTEVNGPLMIHATLQGVELTLQECGDLLRELKESGLLTLMPSGTGVIESHFTIRGVELSLTELRQVAAYLESAGRYLSPPPPLPPAYGSSVTPIQPQRMNGR